VQDRATESITPVRKHLATQRATGAIGAVAQGYCSAEVTSLVHKRLRPTRPVSVIANVLAQGMSVSGDSENKDEHGFDERMGNTAAETADEGGDSEAGRTMSVKDPSACAVAKNDGEAGRRASRRHTQVGLFDFCVQTLLHPFFSLSRQAIC
jgi:hypothetical protein